jgi:putative ATPase
MARPDKTAVIAFLPGLLCADGRVVLAESLPRHTQRLYRLVDLQTLPAALAQKLIEAEEAIYADPDDPMVNWDEEMLVEMFEEAGFEAAAG